MPGPDLDIEESVYDKDIAVDEFGLPGAETSVAETSVEQQIRIYDTTNIWSQALMNAAKALLQVRPISIDSEKCFLACN